MDLISCLPSMRLQLISERKHPFNSVLTQAYSHTNY